MTSAAHTLTEYDRRGPNDRAEIVTRAKNAARATGIQHYVFSNACESWVAGQGARDALWPDLVPAVTVTPIGETS